MYYDRVAKPFLVPQAPLLLHFVFFVSRQRSLAIFTGSGIVCRFPHRAVSYRA